MTTYDYTGKTYLITGGAGFIGAHLCRALLQRNAHVIVVDDFNDFYDPSIKEANIAALERDSRFRLYRQDIREFIGLRDIFERHGGALRHGGIIHLAARAGVRPSLREPRLYLETNVTGTLNLAELSRDFGVRKFIFASSSSVYGDSASRQSHDCRGFANQDHGGGLMNPAPFREDQDISRPISPYASTKAMGESLLHTYSHLYDLQVVALRFFTVYGPGQRPDLAIHKFTRLIDENRAIPVFGDGSTRRDYTYIDDIIQGVMAAVAYDQTPYEIFNLGESQTTALSELIALLEENLGKQAVIDRQSLQPGDVSVTYADIEKARRVLGYDPQTPLRDGIPKFIDWYVHWKETARSMLSV